MACLFWAAGAGSTPAMAETSEREVLASIRPLALLTEPLLQGTGYRVKTLLPASRSPHDYALRVSDLKTLRSAELLIWLGPAAEPYIDARAPGRKLAILEALPPDRLLGDEGHGDHEAHGMFVDPHVWLDPGLAISMTDLIADQLIQVYPAQKALIVENRARLQQDIRRQDEQIRKWLGRSGYGAIFVYHNAYTYFMRRYDVPLAGVIQEHVGGGGMGLKHLATLQNRARGQTRVCIYSEPQFAKASIPSLGEGSTLQGRLDPMGTEALTYPQLLGNLARELQRCGLERRG